MLGQAISMVLPEVVGFELIGELPVTATATDLVLTATKMLRERGVVGKFVEFFGEGCRQLTLADRATIANMSPGEIYNVQIYDVQISKTISNGQVLDALEYPYFRRISRISEYGATMGYFPIDEQTLIYLRQSGRSEDVVDRVEKYLKAQGLFRTYDASDSKIQYSGDLMRLDLSTVIPCVAGPKRPHDRVAVCDMKKDFRMCLSNKIGFKGRHLYTVGVTLPFTFPFTFPFPFTHISIRRILCCRIEEIDDSRKREITFTHFHSGFGLPKEKLSTVANFEYKGKSYTLTHGSVVIASITSCTNTSNPSVMLGSGLLARNAIKAGLSVLPYIKTSLSPGSGVVDKYLRSSGMQLSDSLVFIIFSQAFFHTSNSSAFTLLGSGAKHASETLGNWTLKLLLLLPRRIWLHLPFSQEIEISKDASTL